MKEYQNKNLTSKERALSLLKELSTKEKVAQLTGHMVFFPGMYRFLDSMENGIGQLSTIFFRQCKSREEVLKFATDLQKIAIEKSPHNIPATIHMEGVCGAFINSCTQFASGIARASSFDVNLEYQVGEIVGRQERAFGITYTLAPVLDISRDSRLGRQAETYGEDPSLASAMGVAYTKGVQQSDEKFTTEAVAKHFLAFHAGAGGIHGAEIRSDARELREIYAKPFQAAISEANLKGIMPCYGIIEGKSISVNRRFLTGLLRDEMGFDGVCFSDYGAVSNAHNVHNLFENEVETGYEALRAGMDIEMPQPYAYTDKLADKFDSNEYDMETLDAACLRVLESKFNMGIMDDPFGYTLEQIENIYKKEDQDIALQVAREGIVLLKNDGTLPLKKNIKKIALIGRHAITPRSNYGGYTLVSMTEGQLAMMVSMAGVQVSKSQDKQYEKYKGQKSNLVNGFEMPTDMSEIKGTKVQNDKDPAFEYIMKIVNPNEKSLYEELKNRLDGIEIKYAMGYETIGDNDEFYAEALEICKDADVIITTLGGKYGSNSMATTAEGVDASSINLPKCQDNFLLEASKLNKPIIGLHFDGRPCSSDIADLVCNSLVECWTLSDGGSKAIVDVITGLVNPSGKLPVSVARNAGQIPVFYNHPNGSSYHQSGSIGFADYVDCPHTPRYFFGHGLSYSTFEYSNLTLSTNEINADDTLTIKVDIKNTSNVEGVEIVQIYMKDVYASMARPNIELVGFARVNLNPNETKTVTFEYQPSQLAFLDEDMRWKIEKGEFKVFASKASNDLNLSASFVVKNDKFIDGKTRKFYTIGK